LSKTGGFVKEISRMRERRWGGAINAVPEAGAPMSAQKRLASAGINLLK
jgi:hypothetical protein